MGELHAPGHVTDRPHARRRGGHRVVDEDRTTPIEGDARTTGVEPVGDRRAARRDEQVVDLDRLAGFEADQRPCRCRTSADHVASRADADVHAVAFERLADDGGASGSSRGSRRGSPLDQEVTWVPKR